MPGVSKRSPGIVCNICTGGGYEERSGLCIQLRGVVLRQRILDKETMKMKKELGTRTNDIVFKNVLPLIIYT